MATELKVPSLGMDMEEAKILRWLVEEGATVEKGDPVLEIETDKTSFEVEAPAGGVIQSLRGKEGESLPVGATLAFVTAPGEDAPSSAPEGDAPPVESEPGVTVDEGAATVGAAANGSRNGGAAPSEAAPEGAAASGNGRRLRASPAARKAATEAGVPLEEVQGSGPMGRIYLSDVLAAAKEAPAPVQAPASTPVAAPVTERPAAEEPVVAEPAVADTAARREKLSRVRRIGAERTARSFAEVPHFYLTRDLEVDRLLELRERLKAKMDPAPSVTELLVLAVARTLKDHPRLNARYVDGELELREHVGLGIAVATEDGLVVPVLKDADAMPLRELVPAAKALVGRAREGKLRPDDVEGGTFTISNLGMLGVDHFDAIINAPEAGILAVGRTRTVPEWRDEKWLPKRVISGTISVDHRVADGADGARFLEGLQAAISDWELLL